MALQRYVNGCQSHIIYQMKSQKFPIFWQKTETDTSFFDSAAFLSQFSTISDHSYLENNYKQIEQNILIMTKQPNAEQYLMNLVNLLCQMFKATQLTLFLTLMRPAINVETKYVNTYRTPIDDVLSKPIQNLDSSTPIALPYYPQPQKQYVKQIQPVFGPQLPQGPLVIAIHADSAITDVNQQQKQEDNRLFFKQDNQKVSNYIQNKFKVVKRDGISVYFTMAAQLISSELMEYFLQENYLKLPILTLIQLLQLLDYISAPLFTFYFSDIISVITTKTLALIETKASSKQFTKGHFATLLNLYNSLTDRWQQDSGFNRQHWNWQITTRMISHFISSDVSQKQLHAVKSLGQICRKSRYYNYSISEEKINDFIQKQSILEQIYRGDNHPEVISKGQQIFSYVINYKGLSHTHLDLIFNLLHKCHQNLSKSLFNTIYNIEDQHLSMNREYLLQKIKQLPRVSSFNSQTFSLIRKISMITPPEDIESTLKNLFTIIQNHYLKLKEQLKVEAVKTYYQLFEMGIELETFNQTHALLPLWPVFETKNPELIQKMVAAYISKLQDRVYDQKNGKRFRNILNEGLKLMIQQETRKWQFDEQTFLRILKLLLQSCEEINNNLLGHQLLWQLIRRDNYFAKFIRFYPEDIQDSMIKSLINNPNKNRHDLECILQLFHLMNPVPRKNLEPVIVAEYFNTRQILYKYTLAPQVLMITESSFQKVLSEFADENKSVSEKLSWLILMRQIIKKEDEKGFGQWGPFQCWNDGEIFIKVFNLGSQSKFHQFQLTTKSYSTLFEIVISILKMTGQKFEKTKIKLNDKYVQLHELKQQIGSLTPLKKVSLELYETQECEWFDKTQLFNKDGAFHIKISDALKQLFNNFATQNGRLFPENIANIFKVATGQQNISVHDSRVTSIINLYSNNGQYLTVDEWISFYFQSAQKNAPLVISNLMSLGFKHLFNDQPTFEIYFQNEYQLRKHLAQNTDIYNLLFAHYLAGNQLLNEQLAKTLKILPISVFLKIAIVEQRICVFNIQLSNQLYYWYISTILRAVYSNNLRIENCQKWRSIFRQSNYCIIIQKIFFNYLQHFLKTFSQNLCNTPLFSIIQNFGCILRDLQVIPDLLRSNISQLSPFQPDQKVLPHQKRSAQFFDSAVVKLFTLSTKLFQSKMSLRVSEYCTSTVANLLVKNYKDVNIMQLKVLPELLFHQNDQIRTLFCNFYFLLSNTFKSIKQQFYEINLNKRYDTVHKKCKEYFQALTKMLAFEENDKYCIQIYNTFQKQISQSLQKQPTNQFYETDQALLGKLKVLNQIKIYNPNLKIQQTTIENINHLLEINSSQQIRNILYTMSASMCDLKSNLTVAIKIMDNLHPSKNSHIRGRNKMGIYNLGCICYINSVVQQLQMIDPFRRGIIQTQIQAEQIDFFREFQCIIYQLSFGQRIYIIPENFCLKYLDHNGKPINIRQQHDADQFLNQLFDRLEVRLNSTNTNGLISDNFRGQIVNVINCEKCFHKKERVQNFYILSIQIKNQKNLHECLDKYAETQFICDYFCDYCESKVETIQKYHRFQSLPPYLFIHLQRLVFDLQSMYKIKLDHPVQFPLEIDLSSYFNSEYAGPAIYVLKGFVVHIGSSEGGHYYSLIRCDGDWVKFDDTRIDPWMWNEGTHDKSNAYLLLYEKKTTQTLQKVKTDITIGNKTMMQSVKKDNYNLLKEQIFLQPSFSKFITQVMQKLTPPEILKIEDVIEIWQHAYHPQIHQIPDDFAQQLDIAFEVAFKYFKLDIQCRQLNLFQRDFNQMRESQEPNSKKMLNLQRISYDIMYILHFRPHFAINILAPEFLSTANGNLFSAIYLHRQQKVRQITISFFFKLVLIIKSQLFSSFLHPVPQNELIQKILQKLITGLSQVGKNSTKMNEFFQLIDRLIKIDSRFGQWFQAHKLGPRLIHLILQNQSGLEGLLPNYPFYTNNFRKNYAVTLIVQIIGKLVEFQRDISLNNQDLQIERKAYLNFELYRRLYHDRYENLCLPTIIVFCSKNNQNFTKKILNFVIQNINRFSHNDQYIYRYLHLFYSQVIIQDSLQRQRLERLLGIPLLCKRNDIENQQYIINSQTDRLCIYENPLKKVGDQIVHSFLQLLYINRMQQNYFVLYGIKALLTLMTQNSIISSYIQELPGPCPVYPRYTDWISEFLYKDKKNKQQNKFIGLQQKKSMLEDIALQINKHQNMRSDSFEKINEDIKDPSYKNLPYLIGKTAFTTEWTHIPIQLNQNLILLESYQENSNTSSNQLINAQYRILFCYNSQNQQQAQVIQYKVQLLCKARLYLPTCYTLHFQRGQFQFALPYSQDQSQRLKFYVFEEQFINLHQKKERQEIKNQQKKIQIQKKIEANASNMNDFPTINEVYEGPNDIGQAVREGGMKEESGPEYECPFCCFKTAQFSNRCRQCGQQWGEMM